MNVKCLPAYSTDICVPPAFCLIVRLLDVFCIYPSNGNGNCNVMSCVIVNRSER